MSKGKSYEAIGNVTSRVLFLLAAEGKIVRGKPNGSWLSTQYQWAPMTDWLESGPRLISEQTHWDSDSAKVELARRWLRSFGPVSINDLRWWTGWTATQTKKTLRELAPVEVELDDGMGLVLADDVERVPEPEPWIALLPALDSTPMGWTDRAWFLGPHREQLYDRSGNIGPTVWCDGRIVGAWAQRTAGEIVFRLLEDVGSEAVDAITEEAERLENWLGDVRIIPKFRVPLERALMA